MLKILFAIIMSVIGILMLFMSILLHRIGTIMKYQNEIEENNKK